MIEKVFKRTAISPDGIEAVMLYIELDNRHRIRHGGPGSKMTTFEFCTGPRVSDFMSG